MAKREHDYIFVKLPYKEDAEPIEVIKNPNASDYDTLAREYRKIVLRPNQGGEFDHGLAARIIITKDGTVYAWRPDYGRHDELWALIAKAEKKDYTAVKSLEYKWSETVRDEIEQERAAWEEASNRKLAGDAYKKKVVETKERVAKAVVKATKESKTPEETPYDAWFAPEPGEKTRAEGRVTQKQFQLKVGSQKRPITVYMNPDAATIRAMAQDVAKDMLAEGINPKEVDALIAKTIQDDKGNTYAWKENDAAHIEVTEALTRKRGLPSNVIRWETGEYLKKTISDVLDVEKPNPGLERDFQNYDKNLRETERTMKITHIDPKTGSVTRINPKSIDQILAKFRNALQKEKRLTKPEKIVSMKTWLKQQGIDLKKKMEEPEYQELEYKYQEYKKNIERINNRREIEPGYGMKKPPPKKIPLGPGKELVAIWTDEGGNTWRTMFVPPQPQDLFDTYKGRIEPPAQGLQRNKELAKRLLEAALKKSRHQGKVSEVLMVGSEPVKEYEVAPGTRTNIRQKLNREGAVSMMIEPVVELKKTEAPSLPPRPKPYQTKWPRGLAVELMNGDRVLDTEATSYRDLLENKHLELSDIKSVGHLEKGQYIREEGSRIVTMAANLRRVRKVVDTALKDTKNMSQEDIREQKRQKWLNEMYGEKSLEDIRFDESGDVPSSLKNDRSLKRADLLEKAKIIMADGGRSEEILAVTKHVRGRTKLRPAARVSELTKVLTSVESVRAYIKKYKLAPKAGITAGGPRSKIMAENKIGGKLDADWAEVIRTSGISEKEFLAIRDRLAETKLGGGIDGFTNMMYTLASDKKAANDFMSKGILPKKAVESPLTNQMFDISTPSSTGKKSKLLGTAVNTKRTQAAEVEAGAEETVETVTTTPKGGKKVTVSPGVSEPLSQEKAETIGKRVGVKPEKVQSIVQQLNTLEETWTPGPPPANLPPGLQKDWIKRRRLERAAAGTRFQKAYSAAIIKYGGAENIPVAEIEAMAKQARYEDVAKLLLAGRTAGEAAPPPKVPSEYRTETLLTPGERAKIREQEVQAQETKRLEQLVQEANRRGTAIVPKTAAERLETESLQPLVKGTSKAMSEQAAKREARSIVKEMLRTGKKMDAAKAAALLKQQQRAYWSKGTADEVQAAVMGTRGRPAPVSPTQSTPQTPACHP